MVPRGATNRDSVIAGQCEQCIEKVKGDLLCRLITVVVIVHLCAWGAGRSLGGVMGSSMGAVMRYRWRVWDAATIGKL